MYNKRKGDAQDELHSRICNGHIEVYDGTGAFLFSADTKQEALEELEDAA